MWAQAVNAVLGVWLMFAPAVLGHTESVLGNVDRGIGPSIGAVAAVATTQITRSVRWLNWLFAPVLLVAPWFLDAPLVSKVNSAIVGLIVIALTPIGHPNQSRYGNGWFTLLPLHPLPGWDAERGGKDG